MARRALRVMSDHDAGERTRRYEAAASGRRTSGWIAGATSANSETLGGLTALRNRSRDLVRNDEYAPAAVASIESRMVGEGIRATARVANDRDQDKADAAQQAWNEWAETAVCDADGEQDFYGLEGLAIRSIVEGGETLVRRRFRRQTDGFTVPMQLQLLEGDHLDETADGTLQGGSRVVQGVEFDGIGRRTFYHLFKNHPGDMRAFSSSERSRVRAADILHLRRIDRIGQVRGIPWGAPVLLRLRDLNDTFDARVLREKIANCFTVFVRDIDPSLGDTEDPDQLDGYPIDKLEPGLIEHLPANRQVEIAQPPHVEGFREFADVSLHGVAAGFLVPYEELTGDLSRVSFISGRMGVLGYQARIGTWRSRFFYPMFLRRVWSWFMEAAQVRGILDPDVVVSSSWTAPRWPMIEPGREVEAMRKRARNGFASLSEIQREQGYVPDEVIAELAADMERLRAAGLEEADTFIATKGAAEGAGNAESRAAILRALDVARARIASSSGDVHARWG